MTVGEVPACGDAGTGLARDHRVRRSFEAGLPYLCVAWLFAWWAGPLSGASGGRGVHTQLLVALAAIPALIGLRVWRLPWRSALAALVCAVALLVCVAAPTGWAGGDAASGYVLAGAGYLGVRRFVSSEQRRVVVGAAVCLAGAYHLITALPPWLAAGNSATPLIGSFDGWNAYAAFLLPAAVIGLGLAAEGAAPWRWFGWVSGPLCGAGVVLSNSRATTACLAAAAIVLFAVSVRRRAAVVRLLVAVALTAVVAFGLTGPPFFSHRASPLAAAEQRAATGQTLSQNGTYRTEFWRSAAQVFIHHPITGAGYHSLVPASRPYTPASWARSPNAHDGYLQALSDGGLLLGLPLLAAAVMIGASALRRIWRHLASPARESADLTVIAMSIAILGALAHSAVDADWTYSAIMMEAAFVAACVVGSASATTTSRLARLTPWLAAFAGVGALAVTAVSLHQWQRSEVGGSYSASALLARSGATFGDYRPAEKLLREYVAGHLTATPDQVERALTDTERDAHIDHDLATLRATARKRSGLAAPPGGSSDARWTSR